jgi:hypothetical protein
MVRELSIKRPRLNRGGVRYAQVKLSRMQRMILSVPAVFAWRAPMALLSASGADCRALHGLPGCLRQPPFPP